MEEFLNSPWFNYAVMPLAIVLARVVDVSIGTIRIIFVARGHKLVAPILGFFEVTIWLLAIGQVLEGIRTLPFALALPRYLAYGVGFAAGNYLGIRIEEKVAAGTVAIRVITQRKTTRLPQELRDGGYGVTTMEGMGAKGPVTIVYIVLPRKNIGRVVEMINRYNPRAFYSIESVRSFGGGSHPAAAPGLFDTMRWTGRRKGK